MNMVTVDRILQCEGRGICFEDRKCDTAGEEMEETGIKTGEARAADCDDHSDHHHSAADLLLL
jgi:hypothetical protein